jgi:hypothetical protein
MSITEELKNEIIVSIAKQEADDLQRKEWNKFARLCLKDADYDKETIAFILHVYRGWELAQESSKLSYATTLLNYARHITNY